MIPYQEKLKKADSAKLIEFLERLGWEMVQWGHYALMRPKNEEGEYTDAIEIPTRPGSKWYPVELWYAVKGVARIKKCSVAEVIRDYC